MIPTMTAAEYEKQFGVKPQTTGSKVVSLSSASAPKKKVSIPDAVTNFVGGRGVADAVGAAIAEVNAPKEQRKYIEYPSKKKVFGSAVQLGTLGLPAAQGLGLGGRVAQGALMGYGLDVGSKLQAEKEIPEALTPGVGTLVGGALPLAGKALNSIPAKMEKSNLRMTPTERLNLKRKGTDVAGWLAKKKIVGTPEGRFAKVDRMYDSMEEKIGKVVKESGVKYSKQDILAELQTVPEKFADDPIAYDQAVQQTKQVANFIKNKAPEEVPADLIQKYKRTLFKRAYAKNQTDVLSDSYHELASFFKDKLDKDVKALEGLNPEYGNIISARKALFKATERPEAGAMAKLTGVVGGAALGSAAGPVGAGVGAVAGPAIAEKVFGTPTRSALGASAQTLQDILGRIPTDRTGNLQITQKALIRLLQGQEEDTQ